VLAFLQALQVMSACIENGRIHFDGPTKKHSRVFLHGGEWTTIHNDDNLLVREYRYQQAGTTEEKDRLGMAVVVFKKEGQIHWYFNQTPPFSNFTSSTLRFNIKRMDGSTVTGSVGSSEHAYLLITLLAFGFTENRDAAFLQFMNPGDGMHKMTSSKNLLKGFPAHFFDSKRIEFMKYVYARKLVADEALFDEVVQGALFIDGAWAADVAAFKHFVYEGNPNCDLWAVKLPYEDTTDFVTERDETGKIVKTQKTETKTGFKTLLVAAIANGTLYDFFHNVLPKHGKNMLGKVITPLFSDFLKNREAFKAEHGAELFFEENSESVIMEEILEFYKEPRQDSDKFNAYRVYLKENYPEETKGWA